MSPKRTLNTLKWPKPVLEWAENPIHRNRHSTMKNQRYYEVMAHFISHHRDQDGNINPLRYVRSQVLWDQYQTKMLLRKLAWLFGACFVLSAMTMLYIMVGSSEDWRDTHQTLGMVALSGTLAGPFALIALGLWYAKTIRKQGASEEIRQLEISLERARKNGWSGEKDILTAPLNAFGETLLEIAKQEQLHGKSCVGQTARARFGDIWDSASEFREVDSYEKIHDRAMRELANMKGV